METGNFQIDGLVQQRQELEKLLMSNPAMEKKVQGLIRKVLLQARKVIGDRAKSDDNTNTGGEGGGNTPGGELEG